MSKHRSRIERLGPEGNALRSMRWGPMPSGATDLGLVRRGDDQGRLLRLRSGSLALQLPWGALSTLDQRKAQAMLDAEARHA